jgi:hypothetical protein
MKKTVSITRDWENIEFSFIVNNPSNVLKSQPTNSSGSKKRKGSKISFPNKNRKLGLNYEVPSDLESVPIRRSLQIEQKFKDREICSNSNFQIQSITLLK